MLRMRHVVLALMLGGSVGCGGDSGDEKGGSAQASEGSVTVAISAAEGGEVKLGAARLSIPAGALAEDLEITLDAKQPASSLPERSSLKGLTYDFGPDGTTFEEPVELTLPVQGTPGDDQVAVISWYDEESKAWRDLITKVDGGAVTAEVEHFTLFVVRFKDVAAGAFDCSFSACGGQGIEGSWTMAGACIDVPDAESPFASVPGCEDSVFGVGVDAEGEVTFAGGTYEYSWTFNGLLNIDLSAACFEAVGQGSACEDFQPQSGVACALEGGRCRCSGPVGEPDVSSGTGTYEVSGNTISFLDADDDEPDVQEICVRGNEAKLQQTSTEIDEETGEEETETVTLVLSRK